jgi:MFS family permease
MEEQATSLSCERVFHGLSPMHRTPDTPTEATRFRFLWFGQAVSQLGDYIALFAVPFFVFDQLTDDPAWFGRIFFAETIPAVLFGVTSGLLLDRWSRPRLMVGSDLLRAILFVAMAAFADGRFGGGPWTVMALSFLLGTAAAGFNASLYAYLPSLVRSSELTAANARLRVTQQFFFVLGPAIAGLVIALFGFPFAFMLNAGTFVVSSLTLLALPIERLKPEPTETYVAGTMEGLRFVWRNPILRYVTIGAFMTNFLNSYVESVLVLLSESVFGVSDAQGTSYIFAVFGLGGVLGALTARRVTASIGLGRTFVLGMAIWGVGILASTFTAELAIALPVFAAAGFGLPWVVVANTTVRQVATPPHMLGRVTAAASGLVMAALPIGALLLTSVASSAGVVLVARIVPSTLLLTAVLLVFTPLWREHQYTIDLTEVEEDEPTGEPARDSEFDRFEL